MFSAINRIRLKHDLPILKKNEVLGKAAKSHAIDIITRNFFDHCNPDGKCPRERISALGIPYPVSENLGVLSSYGLTMEEVVEELLKSLMDSPEHRANILNPDITDMGISFVQDKNQVTDFIKLEKFGPSHIGYGTVVVCQEFMKRGLTRYEPLPFPREFKRGSSITINAETYKDFDTVVIELVDRNGGSKLKSSEQAIFERNFSENMNFIRSGQFDLKISGRNYDDQNNTTSEELVTFEVNVN